MPSWKFTDTYGSTYPALANSILSILVFDAPSGNPISGTTFTGSLDLQATGNSMKVLQALLGGLNPIPMTGTVTTDNDTLKVNLNSTDNAALLAALKAIPLLGQQFTAMSLTVVNETPKSATDEDEPTQDEFDLLPTLQVGSSSVPLVIQVPMSSGLFSIMTAPEWEGIGVSFTDLNFLVPGGAFSNMFPSTELPAPYYNPSTTKLSLLSLGLTLGITITPKLSLSVSSVDTSIGITNLPLYLNALYLNPLAVWINITSPFSSPTPTWGLLGSIALYPAGKQTSPPSAPPDFTFDMQMEMPVPGNPMFSVTGEFGNPFNLPVSRILQDLANDTNFNVGIADNITLEKFDFATSANVSTGTIEEFSVEVGMSSPFGLFLTPGFGVKNFSISVNYIG